MGDREKTWTANGAAAPWPELLLASDLPKARLITYGYDADVFSFWSMVSQSIIADHSQKFLTSLANLRDGSDTVSVGADHFSWSCSTDFDLAEHTPSIVCGT